MPGLRMGRSSESDRATIDAHIHRANFVLVTHAHYDHIFDVPCIAERTGATVIGSESTGNILRGRSAVARGAARHLSISRLTVPVPRGNLFEWLKKLQVVIERHHLDHGDVAEPRVISIFEVYCSVLHAGHRGDHPSLSLL